MLEVLNLSQNYCDNNSEICVLKNINLKISSGEIIFLLSPSGTGKTTLLNLLGLLDIPLSGEIYLFGENCTYNKITRSRIRKMHISFIHQEHNLIKNMSSYKNILIPYIISKKTNVNFSSDLDYLATLFGIKKILGRKIDSLSTGEKQRIAIVRALMKYPSLLLADEPTANLDPQNAANVFKLLTESCKKFKCTLIIVTHDESYKSFADRVYTIKEHTLVQI
ncbi:ATP-binding cassette domain-containing protein [Anaplasmataceae bacterium AB001_6]|nr:ATP-binding cassette domain-containing protein [Anaplasmataceae bacterium AB001_6]